MRNVDVQWKGIGCYEVLCEKEVRKKHEEFWKTLRLKKKVVIHPISVSYTHLTLPTSDLV